MLKRAAGLPYSWKAKKTVACLKSPQRQLIIKRWWSQLESNQRYKNFQSFALPAELWDHGTDRRSWTHINGFGDRRSTIELYPHFFIKQSKANPHTLWCGVVHKNGVDNGNRTHIISLEDWSPNRWTISTFGAPEETWTLTHLSISF